MEQKTNGKCNIEDAVKDLVVKHSENGTDIKKCAKM